MAIPNNLPITDKNFSSLGSDTPKVAGKKQLLPDDFIRLFLKQLTNQNPLHPADSATILQQMANISSISASKDMQSALGNLQQNINIALGNSRFLAATQLIGKKVETVSGMAGLEKGDVLAGSVALPSAATNIKVTIKDQNDKVVKEITLDPVTSGGLVDFTWDGLKEDKTAYDPGLYKISAKATMDGKEVEVGTLGAFKVKSIASNPATGELALNVEGRGGINFDEIYKIL